MLVNVRLDHLECIEDELMFDICLIFDFELSYIQHNKALQLNYMIKVMESALKYYVSKENNNVCLLTVI